MRRLARSAWVIARRDYVATVYTRTFLLFLIGPLLPLLFGGLFGLLATTETREAPPPIAVHTAPADFRLLDAARTRLVRRMGADWLPPLIAADHRGGVHLSGGLAKPRLDGAREDIDALRGRIGLLLDGAAALRAGAPAPVPLEVHATAAHAPDRADDRRSLARGAQVAMFFITIILAGMLISNLVEEKSSKVIEVLAAAVPVDAIFLGKLVGMLAVSLTGIAVWGTAGLALGTLALPGGLGTPAIGWPVFAALAIGYWVMLYLLLGALYLGIGAQAGSVREVQTLSLPLTMGQLLFFGLAQSAVGAPDGTLGLVAAAVPWSSPFAMIARAAESAVLWPHLLALGWQALCLFVVVRIAARLFRRNVLKSGGATSRKAAALS